MTGAFGGRGWVQARFGVEGGGQHKARGRAEGGFLRRSLYLGSHVTLQRWQARRLKVEDANKETQGGIDKLLREECRDWFYLE